jgi:2-hydroxychromene-2-carboxylate isomerase
MPALRLHDGIKQVQLSPILCGAVWLTTGQRSPVARTRSQKSREVAPRQRSVLYGDLIFASVMAVVD